MPTSSHTRGSESPFTPGELGAQHDAARGVVLVDEPSEPAELEHVAAQLGAIDVGRAALD